ncbi:MAG: translation initiation factor IF-2 [Lachnospiraceae bacterium]|nr:translation initiation factor IF-2 [Lachnospiraceae bacterium]MBO5146756.1 translation initiation factor IF-2 [Lachnospiraceae bacterium]
MAKIKVYELAQEIGVKSADILALLKNKGIEVKSHMSVLEDGQVEDVKKAYQAPAKSEEAPKTTEKTEASKETKAPAKTGEGTVKKKKSIIFVSNPHNSKMPGGAQIPRKPAHTEKKASAPAKAAVEKAVEPVKAEPEVKKPAAAEETKPVQTVERVEEAVQKTAEKPVQKTEARAAAPTKAEEPAKAEKTVKTEALKAESAVKTETQRPVQRSYDGQRRDNRNDNRSDNQRRDSRNDNRSDNQRRDSRNDNRSDNQRRDSRNDNRSDNQRRNNHENRNDGQRRDGQRSFERRDGQGARPGQGFNGGRDNDRGRDGRGGFGGKNNNKNGGFVPESPIKDAEKHRDEEKRRISQEKDKKNRKDLMYEEDEDGMKNIKGKNKPGKFIKPEKKPVEAVEEQIKVITLPETLTIKELAEKMKIQPSVIVKKLFLQGQIVTVNQEITYETAENIAIEYDIICEQEVKVDVIEELLKEEEENPEDMVPRSPVICVMGHVDHGKTSLLDAIRKTNVTDKEAGGITQHIGAYTVNINEQKITFLDTPGHEAFTAMRMRGANSTDIAILVVAADDGVMPQTVEAINHAKAAGIEIIVAVNKIDKPGANIERVKQELTEYGLIAEDWGGSTVFVPVSAKSGEGIEQLLEMILLTAEVLELKANPNRRARGLVIEAELDKGRGPVATILVQKGTLKVGDFVSAGAASGKVRAMVDDKGRRVKEAGPSTPVEILGLGDVPNAGEIFIAHENDKEAKYYAETFVAQNKEKLLEDTKAKMSLDDLFSQIQAGSLKELNLIIKADVQGSVEAVKQSLMKLSNEEVVVKCIHGGVGAINESDVILASASKAIIIGFNVRPDAQAKATAEREGVDVRLYKVIYQAIEDIEAAMKGMLDPVFEEKVIGHAEVRQIFKASAVGNIAGSYVLDGVFQRGCKVRITREGEQIYEGELASLKRFKDDVKEVKAGFECGLVFEGFDSMQELDIVEAYIMVEVPR